MTNIKYFEEAYPLIVQILESGSNNFIELSNIANLDILQDFECADLTCADMSGGDFSNANLSGANLTGANLCGANLSNANLSSANLSNANLSHANLSNADLSNANLDDCELAGVQLTGANLSGTNLNIFLPILEVKNTCEAARKSGREILNLRFVFPNRHPNEAPAREMGMILSSLQYLISSVGQSIASIRNASRTGKTSGLLKPDDIDSQTTFDVLAFSVGSFKIELASYSYEKDLLGNTLAGDAVEELMKLLKAGSNAEEIRDLLPKLKFNTASRYRNFLKNLVGAKTDLDVDWGSPNPTRGEAIRLSSLTALETLEVVTKIEREDQTELVILGELIGINKNTKKFDIWDSNAEKEYRGKILSSAIQQAENATISKIYEAVIRQTTSVFPATDNLKFEYELVYLNQPTTGNVRTVPKKDGEN
jgi:uncharacterized protein YjbI with pentapeptide repeats